MFVFIQAVEAQQVRHAFSLSDGSPRCQNRDDSTPDFDVGGSAEGFQSELWEIGAKPNFTFPVRHDRPLVRFLRFRGEVRLSDPADAEAETVRTLELLEIIPQHGGFARDVPVIVRRLRDGEEDVMLHAHSPFAPYRHGS